LRLWLRHLHHDLDVTSIFVTHDQEEAMEVASQIVVLNRGKIEQKGTPSEIYENPSNDFVSSFIGHANVFHLANAEHSWILGEGLIVDEPKGVVAHVRPHNIEVEKQVDSQSSPIFLEDWQHLGSTIRLELKHQDQHISSPTIYAEMPNEQFRGLALNKGDRVALRIKHAHWFN